MSYKARKCLDCELGWHGECPTWRPTWGPTDTDEEGSACCCDDLGLVFDEDGNERYADGTMYKSSMR